MFEKLLLPSLLLVSLGLGFCIGGMEQKPVSRADAPLAQAEGR